VRYRNRAAAAATTDETRRYADYYFNQKYIILYINFLNQAPSVKEINREARHHRCVLERRGLLSVCVLAESETGRKAD